METQQKTKVVENDDWMRRMTAKEIRDWVKEQKLDIPLRKNGKLIPRKQLVEDFIAWWHNGGKYTEYKLQVE